MTGNMKAALLAMALIAVAGCGDKDKKAAAPAVGGGAAPAAAPAASGAKYDAAKSTASVSGTVKFTGTKPTPTEITMSDSGGFCQTHSAGKKEWDERFTVADSGGLPNTMVWVQLTPAQTMSGYPEPAAVTLDQNGCRYVPHVFGLRAGQNFAVKNSDQTTHNVHVHSQNNGQDNKAQTQGAPDITMNFKQKEKAAQFQCDVHSWMHAYAFVLDHPFWSVTDKDGHFSIKGLPAGTYKCKVWHEGMTAADMEKGLNADFDVTVTDGQSASHDVDLK